MSRHRRRLPRVTTFTLLGLSALGTALIAIGAYADVAGVAVCGGLVLGFVLGIWVVIPVAADLVREARRRDLEAELAGRQDDPFGWLPGPGVDQGFHQVREDVPERGITDGGFGIRESDRT